MKKKENIDWLGLGLLLVDSPFLRLYSAGKNAGKKYQSEGELLQLLALAGTVIKIANRNQNRLR